MIWLKFLIGLIVFCIITGGIHIKTDSMFIEIAHLNALVSILIISIFLSAIVSAKKTFGFLNNSWERFSNLPTQTAWLFLSWMCLSIMTAHLFRHFNMGSSGFDLAFINNALFFPFGEPILKCDVCVNRSYLGEHSSLSLMLLSPITSILKSTVFVTFIQFIMVGFSLAYFVQKGPLAKLKNKWLYFLIIIFAYKSFRQSLHSDFREDHLAFCSLLLGLTFIHLQKKWIGWILFLVAAFSKENVALLIIPYAIGELWHIRKDSHVSKLISAIVILFIGLFVAFLNFKILMPYWTQGSPGGSPLVMRFSYLGSTVSEIIWNSISSWHNFLSLVSPIFSIDRLIYALVILTPVIFLKLDFSSLLLPVIAGVLMNCIPEYEEHRSMAFHYDLSFFPFLFFWISKKIADPKTTRLQLQLTLIAMLLASNRWPGFFIQQHWPSGKSWKEYQWLSSIKTDSPIAANMHTLGYLVHIKELRSFPDKDAADLSDLGQFSSKSNVTINTARLYVINRRWIYDKNLEPLLLKNGARLISESQTTPGLALYEWPR